MSKHKEKDEIVILTIDGGGIRGIIPVMLLAELERLLSENNDQKPLSSYFDLISGTSTGGLIALALASPPSRLHLESGSDEDDEDTHSRQRPGIFSYRSNWSFRDMYSLRFIANKQISGSIEADERDQEPLEQEHDAGEPNVTAPLVTKRSRIMAALKRMLPGSTRKTLEQEAVDLAKILDIYVQRGEEIFPKSTFRQLQSIGQVFSDKYEVRSLEQLLEQIFSDLSMQDAIIPVNVCTYECYSGRPMLLSSYEKDNFLMRDAARATSAAPTYFSPHVTHPIDDPGREYCLIDGGVSANNPALLAYFEAKKLYPRATHVHIISLGTASRSFSLAADDSLGGGVMGWMDPARGAPLYNVFRSSQDAITNYALNSLPDVSYYRLDGSPGTLHLKLDDASKEHIDLLKSMGETIISEKQDQLSRICSLLSDISR
jgi:patatin-like phospholipase/acyl hydrolase